MGRGLFFSLDGPDGAGKSTQCQLLADWLRGQGRTVTTCGDPGGTQVGSVLRDILLHHRHDMALWCEALLFMASRAQLVEERIRPALQGGQIVLTDRYLLSTVVYQGHAGGLDPQQLWAVGRVAAGGVEPDLTLVLDLPLKDSQARRVRPGDRVESRPQEYQARVREGFLVEAAQQPDCIRVVDATASVETVQEALRRQILEKLARDC